MFIKISKKIEYALIVLNHFHQQSNDSLHDYHATARELSDKYQIPFDTTAKVMQILSHQKLLKSSQGIKGGYQISTDLNSINYLDIYEMIEGKKAASDCVDMGCKLIHTCNISGPINNLNQSLINFMQGLSLADLFDHKTPQLMHQEANYG